MTDADEGTTAIDYGAVVTQRKWASYRTYVLAERMLGLDEEERKVKVHGKGVGAAETRCHRDE